MSEFYEETREVARDVLGEFKQGLIQYVKITPGAGPADDPGEPGEAVYDYDAVARGVSFRYVDGTNVVRTDLQSTLAVRDDVTPDIKGFMQVDGVRHKIIEVRHIPPAGVIVAHIVIFRK